METQYKKNWKLIAAVWRCATINHAIDIAKYNESKWIKAIVVTSDKNWRSLDEAKALIESGEADMILVVGKVEWRNIKKIGVVISYAPTQSERIMIQVGWRWLRKDDENDKKQCVFIEPNSRQIVPNSKWPISNKKWLGRLLSNRSTEPTKESYDNAVMVVTNFMTMLRNIWETEAWDGIWENEIIDENEIIKEKVIKWFHDPKNKINWNERQYLSSLERLNLKISWKWLIHISKLFWIKWNVIWNLWVWCDFLILIWINVKDITLTEQNVIYRFNNPKNRQEFNNKDRKDLTRKEKLSIKIKGKWIFAISSLFWHVWDITRDKTKWCTFLNQVWINVEYTPLTKVNIIDRFNNPKNRQQFDNKDRKDLTTREILNIKIKWKGFVAISSIIWMTWPTVVNYEFWCTFLKLIWIEVKEITLTKKDVIDRFNNPKNRQQFDNKDRKDLTVKDKSEIKIKQQSIVIISNLFWIKWDPKRHRKYRYDFLNQLWIESEYKALTKNDILNRFTNIENKNRFNNKDRNKLTKREKGSIKIKDKGLTWIVSVFGVKWNPIKDKEVWNIFLKELNISK